MKVQNMAVNNSYKRNEAITFQLKLFDITQQFRNIIFTKFLLFSIFIKLKEIKEFFHCNFYKLCELFFHYYILSIFFFDFDGE